MSTETKPSPLHPWRRDRRGMVPKQYIAKKEREAGACFVCGAKSLRLVYSPGGRSTGACAAHCDRLREVSEFFGGAE